MSNTLSGAAIYIDEFGDRGFSGKASDWFCVTAVIVPDEAHDHMNAVIAGMASVIRTAKPLHWVEHFRPKRVDRREMASRLCASIPGVQVVYVLAHKKTLISSGELRSNNALFYHYVTKIALERAAYACKYWPGGPRVGRVVLEQIKNVAPEETKAYYAGFKRGFSSNAPLDCLHHDVKVETPDRRPGLQLADIYQGMLANALKGGAHDMECAQYVMRIRHQVRQHRSRGMLGYGVKVFGRESVLTGRCWWESFSSLEG